MTKRTVKELEAQAREELIKQHDEDIVYRIKRRLDAIYREEKALKKAQNSFEDTGKHQDEDKVIGCEKKLIELKADYDKFLDKGILLVA